VLEGIIGKFSSIIGASLWYIYILLIITGGLLHILKLTVRMIASLLTVKPVTTQTLLLTHHQAVEKKLQLKNVCVVSVNGLGVWNHEIGEITR